jgi:hypothetical protein
LKHGGGFRFLPGPPFFYGFMVNILISIFRSVAALLGLLIAGSMAAAPFKPVAPATAIDLNPDPDPDPDVVEVKGKAIP